MKIRQTKTLSKKNLLVVSVILIVLAGMLFAILQKPKDTSTAGPGTPSGAGQPSKNEPEMAQPEVVSGNSDKAATEPEAVNSEAFPTEKPRLSVKIVDIKQTSTQLTAETSVQPRGSAGDCTLELTRQGHNSVVVKTTLETSIVSGTRCKNASFDTGSLSRGEWTLTAKVFSGKDASTTTTGVSL